MQADRRDTTAAERIGRRIGDSYRTLLLWIPGCLVLGHQTDHTIYRCHLVAHHTGANNAALPVTCHASIDGCPLHMGSCYHSSTRDVLESSDCGQRRSWRRSLLLSAALFVWTTIPPTTAMTMPMALGARRMTAVRCSRRAALRRWFWVASYSWLVARASLDSW